MAVKQKEELNLSFKLRASVLAQLVKTAYNAGESESESEVTQSCPTL